MKLQRSNGSEVQLEEATQWCMRLAEKTLSVGEGKRLQAWIDENPSNATALDQVIATWHAIETHAVAPELIALRREALAEGSRAQQWRAARLLLRPRPVSAFAAILLSAVLGIGYLWTTRSSVLQTDVGERRVTSLTDGSRVSLDASTHLKVEFTPDQRRVLLESGRAKFDVAKNALRPFSVEAGNKTIVAVGTSFSVELLHREVRVILYEGHITVLDKQQTAATQTAAPADIAATSTGLTLAPGQILVAADGRPSMEISNSDTARSLSWEGGMLAFDDEPMALAVERVNRYAKRKIEIADPAVSVMKISGLFAAGDIDAFLDGITTAFPVKVQATAEQIELVSDPKERKKKFPNP
jgi:transmembrane sensor